MNESGMVARGFRDIFRGKYYYFHGFRPIFYGNREICDGQEKRSREKQSLSSPWRETFRRKSAVFHGHRSIHP
jgi:hypothetical protein